MVNMTTNLIRKILEFGEIIKPTVESTGILNIWILSLATITVGFFP